MCSFRKKVDSDFVEYKEIYDMADMLFGLDINDSFIMQDNNKVRIIFYCPPLFIGFWLEEGKIKTSSFCINEENEIQAFTYEDYQININEEGMVFTNENGNVYFLQLLGNKNEPGFDVENNGTLVFAQYDRKKDTRVVSKFEHNICQDNDTIYGCRLDKPFSITIESKVRWRDMGLKFIGHKDTYYKMDFDVYHNRWQYDLATMKDFGVGAVMASDTQSLQDRNSFSKYYKVLFSFGDYITLTGFPFTRQYDMDYVLDMIKGLGFSETVPRFFLEVYNNLKDLTKGNEEILDWFIKNINNGQVILKK